MTDEFLAAFHELWTSEAPRIAGTYVSFADIRFEPKPVQSTVPIWVGGNTEAAYRRTVADWQRTEAKRKGAGATPGREGPLSSSSQSRNGRW